MSIDWSAPIEAVHEDGRVAAAQLIREDQGEGLVYCSETSDDGRWFYRDDSVWQGWRIRNVAPAPRMTDLSPETVGKQMHDLTEARRHDAALWDPMVTLVRHMVSDDATITKDYAEARAIVAELPEPVDPDLVEAREIIADAVMYGAGRIGDPDRPDAAAFRAGKCDDGTLIQRVCAALTAARSHGGM